MSDEPETDLSIAREALDDAQGRLDAALVTHGEGSVLVETCRGLRDRFRASLEEIEAARARVAAAEAALATPREDLEREFRRAERHLAHLEDRAAEARFAADPLNEALVQSLRAADMDTGILAKTADQLRGIEELRRMLGTYGCEIVRTS